MKKLITASLIACLALTVQAQTNILSTNPLAEEILLGDYNPEDYQASVVTDDPRDIVAAINELVSPDSLKSYLLALSTFETRHTNSDTVSQTTGMGAARRWVHSQFQKTSEENENRLIVSYLQFEQEVCDIFGQHRNVFAVLPGRTLDKNGVIIIEAHLDSRCQERCDAECAAHGMEDNGSGSALVIELARVMSRFTYDRTIVFMATTGEEQGLVGANAFAEYAENLEIPVKAVLNNDVVGGIVCGETSSAPSCPGLNHVDSTQVRLFSASGLNSMSKQLSRYIKMQYKDELEDQVSVPMMVTIMTAEDRSGRGSDHIPFRQRGYPAMRFTSANEHGNANTSDPDYHDRQHTSDDILGVDTDGDQVLDSFFVDFNYLARNAVINGSSASLISWAPPTPEFQAYRDGNMIRVIIKDSLDFNEYLVFVRFNNSNNDFDTIFHLTDQKHFSYPRKLGLNITSVAAVDSLGIESCFSQEIAATLVTSAEEATPYREPEKKIILFQNRPNPFDEATLITFNVQEKPDYREAFIVISDMNGKALERIEVDINLGINEILYRHGYNMFGTYIYSLVLDGKVIDSKRMIFAN